MAICDSDGGTDAGPHMTPEDAEVEHILAMTDDEILALSANPEADAKAARDAFERALSARECRCYVCGGEVGVFTWTDRNGQAHPWCIESERPKWQRPVTAGPLT